MHLFLVHIPSVFFELDNPPLARDANDLDTNRRENCSISSLAVSNSTVPMASRNFAPLPVKVDRATPLFKRCRINPRRQCPLTIVHT